MTNTNWTIKRRIITGFAALLLLVCVIGACSFVLFGRMKVQTHTLDSDALPGLQAASEINNSASDVEIASLHALLSKTPEEQARYESVIQSLRDKTLQAMDVYDKSISHADDRALFEQMKQARDNYVAARIKLFELVHAGKTEDALAFSRATVTPAYNAYSDLIDKILGYNLQNANVATDRCAAAVVQAGWITNGLVLAVLVLGIVLAWMIVSGLNRALSSLASTLNEGAVQVSSAATQVSSSSQSLAEGSSEQAASIEETSASLEELASMTRRNAENAQKANDLAKAARQAADRGVENMQSMTSAVDAIKHSSDDIAKIIKTIDEIAFQTNILALNAAVEAARAGEAGMGFAVVADEVRNLAQRSAQAAKETAGKIEGAIHNTTQGVELSAKVAEVLGDIASKARQVDDLAAEVANASREQTQGITQINTAISEMDKVTQRNAANAEESAAAAQELNAQSMTMKDSVAKLAHLVNGGTAAGQVGSARASTKPAPRTTSAQHRNTPAPARSGQAAPAPQPARHPAPGAADKRNQIPLEDAFKDF
ncbi:MAG: methyl-accepting chemotaxis protein [Verrucomicrobiota bacterium]